MATRAVVGEEILSFLQAFLCGRKRIFLVARTAWDPQIPYRASYNSFDSRRLIGGAESSPNHRRPIHNRENRNRKQNQEHSLPAFHLEFPQKSSGWVTR